MRRVYNETEIAAIRARYVAEGATPLAREMDRDPRDVRQKAWMMGLRRESRKRNTVARNWSPEEDGLIRAEWPLIQRRITGHTAAKLSHRLGVTLVMLRSRAALLGVRAKYLKTPDWSDDELELLERYQHLNATQVYRRFRAAGFRRTPTAIHVMRGRQCSPLHENTNAYSANGLAQLMGVSAAQVSRWISRGLLKATPRSDARHDHGGVGDRWLIYPRHVRAFIAAHAVHVPIAQADKIWLVDLLVGETAAHIQHSAGTAHVASGGFDEYQVAA
jgi:hypothetical protein